MNAAIKGYLLTITAATTISICVIMLERSTEQPISTSLNTVVVEQPITAAEVHAGESFLASKPRVILFISSCLPGDTCLLVVDEQQLGAQALPQSPLVHYLPIHLFGDALKLFTFAGSI